MERILAIDPGNDKCGLALVDMSGRVVWQRIVSARELAESVRDAVSSESVETVILGDRTGSRRFREQWREIDPDGTVTLITVDEHMSSVEGRRRYLRAHPLKGLCRFWPDSMRTPREPYDDFVAVVLAERYLLENRGKSSENKGK